MNKKQKMMEREFFKEKALNKLATPGKHELVIVLDHLKPDFNVGKIFRSADAFGAKEIHLVGIPYFHPGTAMGSFRHVPAKFFEEFDECYKVLKELEYQIYTFELGEHLNLSKVQFPKRSAIIMGHEEYGISFDKSNYPDIQTIMIQQFGKVQSLNVSVAASVAMYEYVRQVSAGQ